MPTKNLTIDQDPFESYSLKRSVLFGIDAKNSLIEKCYSGNTEEFYREINKTFSNNANNFKYWNLIGLCHVQTKNYLTAILYFQKALDLASSKNDKSSIFNNLALAYEGMNNFPKAIAFYHESFKLNQLNPISNFNLASIYLKSGNDKQAKIHISNLTKFIKNDPELLHMLGSLYLLFGDYKKGFDVYSKISSPNMKNLEFYNHYLLLSYLTKSKIEKIEDLKYTDSLLKEKYNLIEEKFGKK